MKKVELVNTKRLNWLWLSTIANNRRIKKNSPKIVKSWTTFGQQISIVADELPCAGDIYNEKN